VKFDFVGRRRQGNSARAVEHLRDWARYRRVFSCARGSPGRQKQDDLLLRNQVERFDEFDLAVLHAPGARELRIRRVRRTWNAASPDRARIWKPEVPRATGLVQFEEVPAPGPRPGA